MVRRLLTCATCLPICSDCVTSFNRNKNSNANSGQLAPCVPRHSLQPYQQQQHPIFQSFFNAIAIQFHSSDNQLCCVCMCVCVCVNITQQNYLKVNLYVTAADRWLLIDLFMAVGQ